MRRNVKKEKQTDKGDASAEPVRTKVAGEARDESADVESNQPNREEDATDRRVLRSKYLAVMTKISGGVLFGDLKNKKEMVDYACTLEEVQ
ncbi:hypothetical protein ES319_D02G064800v1 [Gossypium barbadense]|uniref:Uncharacterized protein n=2 Tax=Gossypium TaxID=3633 RepID=A0A5J5S9S5_GOSBA|nr:hypothetical protein ES319_D02G064800v1 [Gossypium barbadense]TYG78562.1 hypothetical protein ES288_D02G069100v1 [Gossypium darwinii]